MIKIHIEMPDSAGYAGLRTVELPSVPRVGEVIKDANNKFYKITTVVYQPFEQTEHAKIAIEVASHYATSGARAIEGKEVHSA